MNPQHPLTAESFKTLKAALERFGNKPDTQHKMTLCGLLDSMTKMAEGELQGRWAFGLPTGTGKTRAIIEWSTAVHKLNLPYTLAVSASRIEALCTLKREMIENGIPEEKIGLLHDDSKASLPATADNDDRPFMLITHQRIRSKKSNLDQYNYFQGQPRNLLIYDESLMVSDVQNFDFIDLCACLAHAIERTKRDRRHNEIYNYMVEVKKIIEYVYDCYDEAKHDLHLITQPYLDPKTAEHYSREWDKEGTIAHFLRASNLDLRMIRSGHSAVISYKIVIPSELQNMIVLDASFPIRKLCLLDKTIRDAQTLPSIKKSGIKPFHQLKRFDNVQLCRLRSFGGRHTMEKRFKDRSMAKEVVQVLKTIPESEAVLFYVYKLNQPGGIDYQKILAREIQRAGIDIHTEIDGKPRITIQTWGNETSLNSYAYCSHVFLVGILHRDDIELMGQYLAQTNDIRGEVNKTIANELQLSEKAHLAYQALSRGTCRTVSNGKALPMKGYIVEIDEEIETTLNQVMPGVTWEKWKPYFVPESEGLIDTWAKKVLKYLDSLEDWQDTVSSKYLKRVLKAETIAPRTWTRIIQAVSEDKRQGSKEDSMEDGVYFQWNLKGRSLIKKTAERYGFKDESGQAA